ncbi:Trans-1,2-dihydrobenzene-1,2-diol dehydrogenase [Wickerhamomyces ciferrii]|uniref:D-xylose 1-dehydrogenase (NADP(+), D-xylono-1,5-lactone-forming) n=1 Tax=Wickerhamomyces ciferrii (strain ATCC 14091 / BCRC 22168 / CBS 111 / JCM 3599 / NBRC 0793 / NRRL Y-1031 F-60-10) TaxID=1206466 RepID=K0KVP6_WICCF|nr:Trans-1,2-dihydrobenzene-1,2-diol dehydrogenase [Wickerhamomyces ciferrii]CCH46027.1 Trans-1,2-dihydrobenzene-1,2-diol dehydrogenase [Wickerhamomyces ciferrii]
MTFEINWGIVGLGSIATKWAKELLTPNEERPTDIKHNLLAVSSSSNDKGEKFVNSLKEDTKTEDLNTQVYTDYEEFLNNSQIDIVYIASPNTAHYKQALAALKANKNVLVEKTACMTAEQAEVLYKLAKEKNLYIVEGVWTRFFPTTLDIIKLVKDDKILGGLKRVSADLSHDFPFNPADRIFDPKAGGGALMDSLIYSLTWSFALLEGKPLADSIVSTVTKLKQEGFENIDETTVISLVFPDQNAVGVASGSLSIESPNEVLIEGENGYIRVLDRTSKPTIYTVKLKEQQNKTVLKSVNGTGLFYEIDSVGYDLKNKKITSDIYPFDQTIEILKIFDKVRKDHDITFPEKLLQI